MSDAERHKDTAAKSAALGTSKQVTISPEEHKEMAFRALGITMDKSTTASSDCDADEKKKEVKKEMEKKKEKPAESSEASEKKNADKKAHERKLIEKANDNKVTLAQWENAMF